MTTPQKTNSLFKQYPNGSRTAPAVPSPFPNPPPGKLSGNAAGQLAEATMGQTIGLYNTRDKFQDLAGNQRANSVDLANSLSKVIDTQIENEVSSENSSQVLRELITSLRDTAVTTKPSAEHLSTADINQVAAENAITSARTFTHSLLHIVDDGLVWMDATQVNSMGKSAFGYNTFQSACTRMLNQVNRKADGSYYFNQWWLSRTRNQQMQWISSLLNLSDAQYFNNSGAGCVTQGNLDTTASGAADTASELCDAITLMTEGGGRQAASSFQDICDSLYQSVKSTGRIQAQSSVYNQITPSFITNVCSYSKLFMQLQQACISDGEVTCTPAVQSVNSSCGTGNSSAEQVSHFVGCSPGQSTNPLANGDNFDLWWRCNPDNENVECSAQDCPSGQAAGSADTNGSDAGDNLSDLFDEVRGSSCPPRGGACHPGRRGRRGRDCNISLDDLAHIISQVDGQ